MRTITIKIIKIVEVGEPDLSTLPEDLEQEWMEAFEYLVQTS